MIAACESRDARRRAVERESKAACNRHRHRASSRIRSRRDRHVIGRQLNRYYKEGDAFFSSKQTNIVDNQTPADVLERIVYAMGNPVADGIEREGRNHKGIRARWPQPDKVIKRPEGLWRRKEDGGVAPDELVLRFTRPPGFDDLSDAELDQLIEGRVLAYEQDKREERDAEGLAFRCDVTDEKPDPRSYPKSRHQLFRLAPLLGARLKQQRLAAITRLREFRARHKDARQRVKAGEQGVVFPCGTYLAFWRWNVLVESAPT